MMLLLASVASPPIVPIGQVFSFDDGSHVLVVGVLVEMYLRDDGAANLVLADITDGETLRVYCTPGLHEQPNHLLSIGDEARIEGEISKSGSSNMLFATSDGITLLRRSESVLSLEVICRNWALFEGDSFKTNGIVINGDAIGDYRLSDSEAKHSILLRSDNAELADCVGKQVAITAVLRLDPALMCLVLIASSLSPGLS
jgi:hypothetical protein